MFYVLVAIAYAYAVSVENQYLVVFKKDVSHDRAILHVDSVSALVDGDFRGVTAHFVKFNMYAIHASEELIESLKSHDDIDFIEKDRVRSVSSYGQTDYEVQLSIESPFLKYQYDVTEALSRISHRTLRDAQSYEFVYDPRNVTVPIVYVIDAGCQITHEEFGGRASWGQTFVEDGFGPHDAHNHGTAVLSASIGKALGVARAARGVSLRVLDVNGKTSDSEIIAAIHYALYQPGPHNLKVVNISVGGADDPSASGQAINNAVNWAAQWGMHVVSAAGNNGHDLAKFPEHPAVAALGITVGSINKFDERSQFSNYGGIVDFVAPGESVRVASTGPTDDVTAYMTGTSVAAPLVSGVIAYLLSIHGAMSPEKMRDLLMSFKPERPKGFEAAHIIYTGSRS